MIVTLDLRRRAARFGPDLTDQRRMLLQVIVVFERQVFISTLGRGNCVGVFEVFEWIESLNRKRLRADAGNLLVDILVEALD